MEKKKYAICVTGAIVIPYYFENGENIDEKANEIIEAIKFGEKNPEDYGITDEKTDEKAKALRWLNGGDIDVYEID